MIGVDKMYICLECKSIFNEPEKWVETHGLSSPPYESWSGCPYCRGSYAETYQCERCGEWIEGSYIKIDDNRYCEYCYDKYELGEE